MAFLRQWLSFDKTGIKGGAPCPVFARALLSPDPADWWRWIIKRAGNLVATWQQASSGFSGSAGVVGSVWIMHGAADIQQRGLGLTQKKTNKTLTGTKRCSRYFQCHPRKIQNKVIKGKLICLEHCSGITGFQCLNLLPKESYQFCKVHPALGRLLSETAFWPDLLEWLVGFSFRQFALNWQHGNKMTLGALYTF